MKEYKLLSQKDKWHSSKFDLQALEDDLNEYAKQGWEVIAVATPSFGSSREEFIAVLEREKE